MFIPEDRNNIYTCIQFKLYINFFDDNLTRASTLVKKKYNKLKLLYFSNAIS